MIFKKKPSKPIYSFEYAIDIRGHFPENMYLGMCSYKIDEKNRLWKNFCKEFPKYKKVRYKSSKLSDYQLLNIAKFLDKHRVHMTVLPLQSTYLKKLKDKFVDKHMYKEMIMGVSYFTLVEHKVKKSYPNTVFVDHDNWMDIAHALKIAKKVGEAYDYNIDFATTRAIHNNFIRLSDYVAALKDRVSGKDLSELNYLTILDSKLPNKFLEKALKK